MILGRWDRHDDDLAEAADGTKRVFVESIAAARTSGTLRPAADERTAALLMSLIHGAIDLSLGGHFAADGKGRSEPGDLIDELLDLLSAPAARPGRVTARRRAPQKALRPARSNTP